MPRREESDDFDSDEQDDEDFPRLPRRRRRGRSARRPDSVRRWAPGGEANEEERESDEDHSKEPDAPVREPRFPRSPKRPVFFRARDSIYFEPLVALAVLVLLLVALFAYTQNWPPLYIVESMSMQHGTDDHLGLINTGDLVLAQRPSANSIVTYEAGAVSGYSTYGEYGDVLLYWPDGQPGGDPTIHRAIVYLQWNSNGSYSAPELSGRPCGFDPKVDVWGDAHGAASCDPQNLRGNLALYGIGWKSVTVNVTLAIIGDHSGYLTMGDNNYVPGRNAAGIPDQPSHSSLAETGWIVGVARGMLPWFGALKLLLQGNAQEVPPQSWQLMGITIIGLILAALGVHYIFRAEGVEDERRLEQEREDERREQDEERPAVRRWSSRSDDEEEDEEEESDGGPPSRRGLFGRRRRTGVFAGRPKPKVRWRDAGEAEDERDDSPPARHRRRRESR